MMSVEKILKKISTVSKKNKIPVYIVGGFVRDLMMGVPQKKDIDFVIEGSGIKFAELFDEFMKKEGSLIKFSDFDTARYIIDDKKGDSLILEFAGARSESYTVESRKPKVVSATLQSDLSRRDFRINAMAVPVEVYSGIKKPTLVEIKKKLIDPFDGTQDIKNKILVTPLDPDQTFSDDPLRMLRAVRFAAQLNFGIDKKVLESIHKNCNRLKIVSAERIQEELFKLMSCVSPSVGLILMFQTGLLDAILPEVSALDGVEEVYGHQHKNNLFHTFKVVDNIAERSDKILLRLAGLFHDIGKTSTKKFLPKIGWTFYQHEHVGRKMVSQIAKRLHLSNDDADYLRKLVRWHQQPISLMDEGITDSAVRRIIVNLGDELDDLLILGRSDITTGNPSKKSIRLKNYDKLEKRIVEVLEKDKLRAFQSPVRGDEIMKVCGLNAGPVIGKIKKEIEEAILDGIIPNEYQPAYDYMVKIKNKYLK